MCTVPILIQLRVSPRETNKQNKQNQVWWREREKERKPVVSFLINQSRLRQFGLLFVCVCVCAWGFSMDEGFVVFPSLSFLCCFLFCLETYSTWIKHFLPLFKLIQTILYIGHPLSLVWWVYSTLNTQKRIITYCIFPCKPLFIRTFTSNCFHFTKGVKNFALKEKKNKYI